MAENLPTKLATLTHNGKLWTALDRRPPPEGVQAHRVWRTARVRALRQRGGRRIVAKRALLAYAYLLPTPLTTLEVNPSSKHQSCLAAVENPSGRDVRRRGPAGVPALGAFHRTDAGPVAAGTQSRQVARS